MRVLEIMQSSSLFTDGKMTLWGSLERGGWLSGAPRSGYPSSTELCSWVCRAAGGFGSTRLDLSPGLGDLGQLPDFSGPQLLHLQKPLCRKGIQQMGGLPSLSTQLVAVFKTVLGTPGLCGLSPASACASRVKQRPGVWGQTGARVSACHWASHRLLGK